MWLKDVPACIIAIERMTCPASTRRTPKIVRVLLTELGTQARLGKKALVMRHSTVAAAWAIAKAGQFEVRRYALMVASRVLYAAVVQNSKKWNAEREAKRKGTRQRGLSVKRRIARIVRRDAVRVAPRQNARRAIPARDLGWFGRYASSATELGFGLEMSADSRKNSVDGVEGSLERRGYL
jgi:uncharacterized glyoxalase superfamily metalloenzyme YdcJ